MIYYRTNSYTQRQNPFTTPVQAMLRYPNQEILLKRWCSKLSIVDHPLREVLVDICNHSGFRNLNLEILYSDLLQLIHNLWGTEIEQCIWFTHKANLLNRELGYGRFLCQENGILKYDVHDSIIALEHDILVGCKEPFELEQDKQTNAQLINNEQLQQLLLLEKKYNKLLVKTNKKKDVLNIFKLEPLGLLGDFKPKQERQKKDIYEL